MTQGPPPAPMRTREHDAPHRPGSMQFTPRPGNRPDLNMSRGNEGVEMRNETLISYLNQWISSTNSTTS